MCWRDVQWVSMSVFDIQNVCIIYLRIATTKNREENIPILYQNTETLSSHRISLLFVDSIYWTVNTVQLANTTKAMMTACSESPCHCVNVYELDWSFFLSPSKVICTYLFIFFFLAFTFFFYRFTVFIVYYDGGKQKRHVLLNTGSQMGQFWKWHSGKIEKWSRQQSAMQSDTCYYY